MLDTNVFRGDVYAQRSQLRAVFERAASGAYRVVVPRICVEELVRQFPSRMLELEKEVKAVSEALRAFGLRAPAVPRNVEAVAEYRDRLEKHLGEDGCEIAEYPADAYLAAEWTAQRRKPIKDGGKEDGKGAPDAVVWLTVLALARDEDIVLVTANRSDFAEGKQSSKLHATLLEDLKERQIETDRVELVPSLFEFMARYVTPAEDAKAKAEGLLADEATRETLRAEISDAAQWYQVSHRQIEEWALGLDIEAAHLADVEVADIELVAVEPRKEGLDLSLRASCDARVDLMIWKYDAYDLSDEQPIRVYDFDWNESMAAAEIEQEIVLELQCDYQAAKGQFGVEIVGVEFPDGARG